MEVSRQTINNVLKMHKRNGFPYKGGKKNWNYFRAKSPNDLWQMDVKGPFRIEGKKQYALIIIDDNSRYILHCNIYDRINWKSLVSPPPPLPLRLVELISMLYQACCNEITNRDFFNVPPLKEIVGEIKSFIE